MDARLFLSLHEAREEVFRRTNEVAALVKEKEVELSELHNLYSALKKQLSGLNVAIEGVQDESENLPNLPTEVYPVLVQPSVMDRRDG